MTLTTASKVTLARILFVPLFVVEMIAYVNGGNDWHRVAAIVCFALSAGGDAVDGYIARHFNQKTDLGAILDPTADKLLVVSALVVLCMDSHQRFAPVPWWLLAAVLTRDLILLGGMVAIQCASGKFVARPRVSGKIATILLMTAISWALLQWSSSVLPFFTIGAGLFTFVSGMYYLYDFMQQWRGGQSVLKMATRVEVPR